MVTCRSNSLAIVASEKFVFFTRATCFGQKMRLLFVPTIMLSLVACSNKENVIERNCDGLNGSVCVEITENRSGGAPVSEYKAVMLLNKDGKNRSTVLKVLSPDAVTYQWHGRNLTLLVKNGLIDEFRSYWFDSTARSHYPNGDIEISLSHHAK